MKIQGFQSSWIGAPRQKQRGAPINFPSIEPIAKVVIPVQPGIQKFSQHIEKTEFPLSWE